MKAVKFIAAIAAATLATSAFALSSNWHQFDENDQAKYYVDPDTYQVHKTQSHLRQIWRMIVLKKPGKDGSKYYRTLVQHDCQTTMFRVAAIQVSDTREKVLLPLKPSSLAESPWVNVIPDGVAAEQHRLICSIQG